MTTRLNVRAAPLCLVQRGFFYAVLAVCLVAALQGAGGGPSDLR